MKNLYAILILLLLSSLSYAQDLILLKNSSTINGKVIDVGTTEIKYKKTENPDGPSYSIPKSDVLKITFKNGFIENITATDPKFGLVIQDLAGMVGKDVNNAIKTFESKKLVVERVPGESTYIVSAPVKDQDILSEGWGFDGVFLYPNSSGRLLSVTLSKFYQLYDLRNDDDFPGKPYDDSGKKFDVFGNLTHNYPLRKNEVEGNDELSQQQFNELEKKFTSYYAESESHGQNGRYWPLNDDYGLYMRSEDKTVPVEKGNFYNPVRRLLTVSINESQKRIKEKVHKEETARRSLYGEYDTGQKSLLTFDDLKKLKNMPVSGNYDNIVRSTSKFLIDRGIYHNISEIKTSYDGICTIIRFGGRFNTGIDNVEFNDGGIIFRKGSSSTSRELLLVRRVIKPESLTKKELRARHDEIETDFKRLGEKAKQAGYILATRKGETFISEKEIDYFTKRHKGFLSVSLAKNHNNPSTNFLHYTVYYNGFSYSYEAKVLEYPILMVSFLSY